MDVNCRKMTEARRKDAELLLQSFLRKDPYYLETSEIYGDQGLPALRRALKLFLRRKDLGFVWLAYALGQPVGACVVSYAISTSIGGLVAKLDDVYVTVPLRRQGIATQMLRALIRELKGTGIRRIDTAVISAFATPSAFIRKCTSGSLRKKDSRVCYDN